MGRCAVHPEGNEFDEPLTGGRTWKRWHDLVDNLCLCAWKVFYTFESLRIPLHCLGFPKNSGSNSYRTWTCCFFVAPKLGKQLCWQKHICTCKRLFETIFGRAVFTGPIHWVPQIRQALLVSFHGIVTHFVCIVPVFDVFIHSVPISLELSIFGAVKLDMGMKMVCTWHLAPS